jgi:hypothetical protein
MPHTKEKRKIEKNLTPKPVTLSSPAGVANLIILGFLFLSFFFPPSISSTPAWIAELERSKERNDSSRR